METFIFTIDFLKDVNMLNSIDEDIDILIIKKMFFPDDINIFFKNVKFPVTLKKIFIKNCIVGFETANMINLNLLVNVCKNIPLPFGCELNIRFVFFEDIIYYSLEEPDKMEIQKMENSNTKLSFANNNFLNKIRMYED